MKIDLHVHTSEISGCAGMGSHEVIDRYIAAGYDAIVMTNHYNNDTASHFERHGKPDFNKLYKDAYEDAAAYGREKGLLVLNGYELRFNENSNDYLVYGMPDEVIEDYKAIFALRPGQFAKIAREKNFLFYQAHPFRNGMAIRNPDYFFGIEVKNGHPDHDSRNDIALMWAKKFGLHMIGGSDCHHENAVGRSGIETCAKVETIEDLVEVLRNDNYTIL